MRTLQWLRWVERGLFAIGAALAIWCALVLVEARRTQSMPIPPPTNSDPAPLGASSRSLPSDTAPAMPPAAAPGNWLARLDAPTLGMRITVLEGTDDRTLARGAGHIEDTPLPGQPGNIGIAGHRDTVFRPLRRAAVGAPITLLTRDRTYHYTINRTLIVRPQDVYVLDATAKPTLTLVTCYPFEFIGHAPKRFIVQAELVGEEPRTAPQ